MNTEIGFLNTLERDLSEAASRPIASGTKTPPPITAGRRMRRVSWTQVAAVVVALLVAAGGIGFLAQGGLQSGSTAASVPQSALGQSSPAPHPPKFGAVQPGTQRAALTPSTDNGTAGGGGVPLGTAATEVPGGADLSKIVRDGSISVQIPDGGFANGLASVAKIATEAGGFILSSTTANETAGVFTLRIPAKNFDAAMLGLRRLGTVESSKSTGQDVTAQYVDYVARLRILDGRRAVIFRLMSKATTIGETLQLQNVFDQVQLQIEQIRGNLNVLRNQVAESTITVDLHEKDAPKPAGSEVSTPHIGTSVRLAWQGFLRVVGAVVVGMGYLIPIGAIALVIWALTRAAMRRRSTSPAS